MADQKLTEPKAVEAQSDELFWRVTDQFIGHANELMKGNDVGVVNAAFIFASARFNTFLIATQCGNKETFEVEQAAALDYFVNQYKIALTEHMSDYQTNFDKYISQSA